MAASTSTADKVERLLCALLHAESEGKIETYEWVRDQLVEMIEGEPDFLPLPREEVPDHYTPVQPQISSSSYDDDIEF